MEGRRSFKSKSPRSMGPLRAQAYCFDEKLGFLTRGDHSDWSRQVAITSCGLRRVVS